jgi:hypothetical protein
VEPDHLHGPLDDFTSPFHPDRTTVERDRDHAEIGRRRQPPIEADLFVEKWRRRSGVP